MTVMNGRQRQIISERVHGALVAERLIEGKRRSWRLGRNSFFNNYMIAKKGMGIISSSKPEKIISGYLFLFVPEKKNSNRQTPPYRTLMGTFSS